MACDTGTITLVINKNSESQAVIHLEKMIDGRLHFKSSALEMVLSKNRKKFF